jgi:hypothetical protein
MASSATSIRKKPKGRAMPETMRRANNAKSKIRAHVERVFAEQKDRMGLFIRNYRDRPSNDQDRNGQSRLQHQNASSSCATSPSPCGLEQVEPG